MSADQVPLADRLWDKYQVAKFLHYKPRTLERLAKLPGFPARARPGNPKLWRAGTIVDWVRANSEKTTIAPKAVKRKVRVVAFPLHAAPLRFPTFIAPSLPRSRSGRMRSSHVAKNHAVFCAYIASTLMLRSSLRRAIRVYRGSASEGFSTANPVCRKVHVAARPSTGVAAQRYGKQ